MQQYITSLPDGTVLHWRPLKWGEYRKLTSTLKLSEGPAIWHLYDAVAGLCVEEWECPIADEWDDVPAGTIEAIGETILQETGFIPTKELVQKQIDAARGRIQKDYYHTGVAYICAAFNYKPTEVDEMDIEQFMDHLAMAEVALGADISIPKEETAGLKYREVIDPKSGKKIKVPVANPHGKQSKVEIQDGRRRSQ